jgi:hypothetical protein
MPLRPDFKVWVDGEPVVSRLSKQGECDEWNFADETVKSALLKTWEDAQFGKEVSGQPTFGNELGLDPNEPHKSVPYVKLPELGKVWGNIRLYRMSLARSKEEYGRSYGFFVMVRDRLINPNDDKLTLNDPSYGTFYRSQFILNIDGLDEDLLADRERLKRETTRAPMCQNRERQNPVPEIV